MSLTEIQLPENAIDVCINKSATEVAVLHSRTISVYACDFKSIPAPPPRLSGCYTLASYKARQIAYQGDGQLSVLYSEADVANDRLSWFSTDDLDVADADDINCPILNLLTRMDHDRIYCEDTEGCVYEVEPSTETPLALTSPSRLPTACTSVEVWCDESQSIVFGLSPGGTLYGVGSNGEERLQIRNCTSFLVTQAHLIYTTGQHLLKFVHLHSGGKSFLLLADLTD